MNNQILMEQFIGRLEEMADKDLQTELWMGMRKGEMSNFSEAVCGIFNDSDLDRALESGSLDKIWPKEICAKTRLLRQLVREISNKDEAMAIINNPKMVDIRLIAGEILRFVQERDKSRGGRERS